MWIQPLCRHEQRAKALPPYGRQTICEAEIAAVLQVLSSPLLTQGPAVPAFERAVAAWVDARHGVAVNSATSALPIACLALGMVLGPGDGPGAWGWSWGLEVGSGLTRSRLWPQPTAAAIAAQLWIVWTSTPAPLR